MNLIIFDFDGILAELTPRQKQLLNFESERRSDKFWIEFYSQTKIQKPIEKYRNLFMEAWIHKDWFCTIVTGKSLLYRNDIDHWLGQNIGININKPIYNGYNRLFMRPSFDRRPSSKVKKDILKYLFLERNDREKKLLYGHYNIENIVAIDDTPEVIEMYKKEGVDFVLSDKSKTPKSLDDILEKNND